MSSREAARATRSMLASSAFAGIFRPGSSPGAGSFGKSSAGRTRRWKLELPLRISTSCSASRDSISTVGVGERARDLGQQPARQQDRALGLDVGVERRLQAQVEVGGGEGHACPRRR